MFNPWTAFSVIEYAVAGLVVVGAIIWIKNAL